MTENRFPRLRAVLRTAATWGAAWAVAGGALVATIGLFQPNPAIGSLPERVGLSLLAGIAWGVRFGVAGAVIGTAFASVIRFRYRGRRLADISPVRFGLIGAIVGGVGVPLYLQGMNVLFGNGPIAWGLVTDDAWWAAVFGGVAAAGSILLARRADGLSLGTRPDALERADGLDALPAAELREMPLAQRARATQG